MYILDFLCHQVGVRDSLEITTIKLLTDVLIVMSEYVIAVILYDIVYFVNFLASCFPNVRKGIRMRKRIRRRDGLEMSSD